MFNTPVLLIIFNRPLHTQKIFDQIKKIKPKHLFIVGDGPRPHRPDDIQKCAATRKIIEQIDWDCKLRTLFRNENRGCGHGPAEAISWFFEHVEAGIILEDDCLPDISFFPFCELLLKEYKNDSNIFLISGTNPLQKWKENKSVYFEAKFGWTW